MIDKLENLLIWISNDRVRLQYFPCQKKYKSVSLKLVFFNLIDQNLLKRIKIAINMYRMPGSITYISEDYIQATMSEINDFKIFNFSTSSSNAVLRHI